MQSPKRPGHFARTRHQAVIEPAAYVAGDLDADVHSLDADEGFDVCRVICPDCAQSIALLADEDVLPEHALCPSPWDPFGLKVCAGTGRPSEDAFVADASADVQEQEAALLLTLPQGLDWRTQPFSHVGGPASRPIRVARPRDHAA